VRANGTALEARDLDTGEALLRRPRRSGNLLLIWRAGTIWTVNLVERYVGPRLDVDPLTFQHRVNGAYARLDLAAQRSLGEHVAPYLRLENLLGRRYMEVLGYPALGRTVVGGVALRF
jgi:vitamin B12 transporter